MIIRNCTINLISFAFGGGRPTPEVAELWYFIVGFRLLISLLA